MDPTRSPDIPLPPGTRLVHIGPPKTATTSLQGACWEARHELRRQGVRYAGPVRHSANAARAAAGMLVDGHSDRTVPAWFWNGIVREVRRAREPRVLYTSEYLAHAKTRQIQQIVSDLDPGKIHVLITLRPIAQMLTSLWQQQVANGGVQSLDAWLDACLGTSGPIPDHQIWWQHKHHELVQRWADVIGRDRLTVLVADPSDHNRLLRHLEQLLAIHDGTLRLQPDFLNRSLTLPEAEVLRALNLAMRKAGMQQGIVRELVRESISSYLETRSPPADEARIRLPMAVQSRVEPLARAIIAGIRASGVRVLGDLDILVAPATTIQDGEIVPTVIPAELAAALAMGVAYAAGMLRGARPGSDHLHLADTPELPYLSGRDLLSIPVARAKRQGPLFVRYRLGLGAP